MTKLFLHIGTHKTGSTAIQHMLHRHRRELAKEGVLYPNVAIEDCAHHRLAWACGLGHREVDPDYIARTCKKIAAEAAKLGTDLALSSEEFGYLHNLEPLRVLLDHFDVKVVLYVRKQDHYLESVYNQHVRMYSLRFSGSIYQFFPHFNFFNQFNYRSLAGRWEKMFGLENIIVRPYGTSAVGPDVRKDFLNTLEVAPKAAWFASHSPKTGNMSLSATAISYLSHINQVRLGAGQHQNLIAILTESMSEETSSRLLRPEDALAFYRRFAVNNRLLFSRYMGKDSIPFDELLDNDLDKRWVNHEQIDIRRLLVLLDQVLTSKVSMVPSVASNRALEKFGIRRFLSKP